MYLAQELDTASMQTVPAQAGGSSAPSLAMGADRTLERQLAVQIGNQLQMAQSLLAGKDVANWWPSAQPLGGQEVIFLHFLPAFQIFASSLQESSNLRISECAMLQQ